MAHITIVSTNKVGKLDFNFGEHGDGDVHASDVRYNSSDIKLVSKFRDYVGITWKDEQIWYISYKHISNYSIVDAVDAVTEITDNDQLYDLIIAL